MRFRYARLKWHKYISCKKGVRLLKSVVQNKVRLFLLQIASRETELNNTGNNTYMHTLEHLLKQ